jgi:uncharacterized protein
MGRRPEFWHRVPLDQMTHDEWEALCDGCGKCCLIKLEDDQTGEFRYTSVACRLFDDKTCKCGNYALRRQLVRGCVVLKPENLDSTLEWMPATCAYKLIAEGKPLFAWHPLLSDRADSVHEAGESVRGRTTPEYSVPEDELEDHLIEGML